MQQFPKIYKAEFLFEKYKEVSEVSDILMLDEMTMMDEIVDKEFKRIAINKAIEIAKEAEKIGEQGSCELLANIYEYLGDRGSYNE